MFDKKELVVLAPAQFDPPAWVSLEEAAQRLTLDHATVARIRSLLNGMALRWCSAQGVRYRLTDVVAAVAWVRAEAARAPEGRGGWEAWEPVELDHWADAHAPTEEELFPLVDGDDDVDRMQW